MNTDLFKQGPMSKVEAEAMEETYSKRGRNVVITESFDDQSKFYVFVDLPKSHFEPKSSKTFQNKMWA